MAACTRFRPIFLTSGSAYFFSNGKAVRPTGRRTYRLELLELRVPRHLIRTGAQVLRHTAFVAVFEHHNGNPYIDLQLPVRLFIFSLSFIDDHDDNDDDGNRFPLESS